MCAYVGMHMPWCALEVRGQLVDVSSLLECESWGQHQLSDLMASAHTCLAVSPAQVTHFWQEY